MSTNAISGKNIKRSWHEIDAKNQTLGRLATEIAKILMGKNKADYVPYLDTGDYVVVLNAKQVKVSGKKAQQKNYYRHSGFPGGFRQETFEDLLERRPVKIIEHAVRGMLPKNRLGDKMLQKLYVYEDDKNPHKRVAQGKEQGGENPVSESDKNIA